MSLGPLDDKAQIVRFTCYLRSKIMMRMMMVLIMMMMMTMTLPGRVGEISDSITQSLSDFNGPSFQ